MPDKIKCVAIIEYSEETLNVLGFYEIVNRRIEYTDEKQALKAFEYLRTVPTIQTVNLKFMD